MRIDSHVHVVDLARFPPPHGPGYRPRPDEVANADDLLATLDRHGTTHAVVVQLSGYGTDNRSILDAVRLAPHRLRAIASLDPKIPDRELDRLVAGGVVGARLNVVNLGAGVLAGAETLLQRLGDRGLVAQIQCSASLLPEFAPLLLGASGPILFDHCGLPDPARGLDDPGLRCLLRFGETGAFLKLSGAFRFSREPFPHDDLGSVLDALLASFAPDRRVWGSDWPFVAMDSAPSYSETMAVLQRWLPDPSERRMALEHTPRRLFGLDP